MVSEAQKKANAKYKAGNIKQVNIKLNINTDLDILERLEEVKNVNGYIKDLIRGDIQKM